MVTFGDHPHTNRGPWVCAIVTAPFVDKEEMCSHSKEFSSRLRVSHHAWRLHLQCVCCDARGSARCFTASPLGKLSSSCYIWFLPTTGSASQLLLLLLSLVLTFFSVLFALCLKKNKTPQVVSSIPSRGSTSRPSTPPASVQPLADDGSNDVTASRCENHVTWESPHTESELTQVFQQPAFVDLHQQVFCFVSFFWRTFKGIHSGHASLWDKHKTVFFFSLLLI